MDERYERQLRGTDRGFQSLIRKIPLQTAPELPPGWLRCEILERYLLLGHVPLESVRTVVEVGAGPHAISTIPLAHRVGRHGRILAIERGRWGHFRPILAASGLADRVHPVTCDARRLPIASRSADLAACLHGVRSLGSEAATVEVFREMLRVAGRLCVAESLPIARTAAERAHLGMYELREEVFLATTGRPDDLHYRPLEVMASLVERAGGTVEASRTLNIDLPHALAYFPRTLAESVPSPSQRTKLLAQWDEANSARRRFGEDHPPVGIVVARPQ